MVGQSGLSIEEQLYQVIRCVHKTDSKRCYQPLTENLIIHWVGKFGLDILKETKYLKPTAVSGQYVLWCES